MRQYRGVVCDITTVFQKAVLMRLRILYSVLYSDGRSQSSPSESVDDLFSRRPQNTGLYCNY